MNIKYNKINSEKFNSKFLEKLESKEIHKIFKFYVSSQDAKLSSKPAWGPILSSYLNKDKLQEFCELFNKSMSYTKGTLVPVYFILYSNKSFDFVLRTPNIFHLLKNLNNVDKLLHINDKQIYYITYEELYWFLLIKNNFDKNNLKYLLKIFIHRFKDFNIKVVKNI